MWLRFACTVTRTPFMAALRHVDVQERPRRQRPFEQRRAAIVAASARRRAEVDSAPRVTCIETAIA